MADAPSDRPLVLFLCTANACRSQMGEAICRLKWPSLDVWSAGVRPGRPDPRAILVLEEVGADMSGVYSKSIDEVRQKTGGRKAALVVTVCDNAAAECPAYLNTRRQVHSPFRDPPALARAAPEGSDVLAIYREVRDEIAAFVDTLGSVIPELAGQDPLPLKVAALSPSAHSDEERLLLGAATPTTAAATPSSAATAEEGLALSSATTSASKSNPSAISFFERWLTLWVLLCMIVGGLIGYFAPSVAEALGRAEFAKINAIVAVLLWIMIFPMLVQIDFASIMAVRRNPGAVALTTIVNYLVKPLTMYGIAILFFRAIYTHVIPDSELRDSYIAGLILLAGAPCTAMVFVWSALMGGDAAYTLVQVAFNDLLMLALYVPTAAGLIGASNIALPWETIILAVALFIVAPLVLAAAVRTAVIRTKGEPWLQREVVGRLKPFTIIALLATLVLIFIFQGSTIGNKPLHIVLLAAPIIIQTVLNFGITYYAGYVACVEHSRLGPASLIATSNFFELAVAVAISTYGLDSGAALATVVGVLVEVPVMLALTRVVGWLRPRLEKRIAKCDEVCPWAKSCGQQVGACCTGSKAYC